MTDITYVLPKTGIKYQVNKGWQQYQMEQIAAFQNFVVENRKVKKYLDQMTGKQFFLVASTGLGKTVGGPGHVLLKQWEAYYQGKNVGGWPQEDFPRVWVIEPKIPIAEDEMAHLNKLFAEFIATCPQDRPHPYGKQATKPELFGCQTSTKKHNWNAPILLVTTGMFPIAVDNGWIVPGRDRVMIDEAHVTIESDEKIELIIAPCRQMGIPVDYMSATCKTDGLEETLGVSVIRAMEKQQPIWMHNMQKPMEDCIVDLVEQTLVHPDYTSSFFPQGNDENSRAIRAHLVTPNRARGMLIVVNSFAGENSDAKRIERLLKAAPFNKSTTTVHILPLASAIVRNKEAYERFNRHLQQIIQAKELFAIVATRVVEMGVTFEDLDFVVTMDSGYTKVTIGDTVLPELGPLGVNSLLQTIGRVGRTQPGIGYITNEVGAPYATLSDEQLNSGTLAYEEIGLPLRSGSLGSLAYYSFVKGWENPEQELATLNVPSKIHLIPERIAQFLRQRQRLQDIGIAGDKTLTPLGEQCYRWAGMTELAYAYKLQEALTKRDKTAVFFYLVCAALLYQSSQTPSLSDLFDRDGAWELDTFAAGAIQHMTQRKDVYMQVLQDVQELYQKILGREATVQEADDMTRAVMTNNTTLYRERNWMAICHAKEIMEPDEALIQTTHRALFNRPYGEEEKELDAEYVASEKALRRPDFFTIQVYLDAFFARSEHDARRFVAEQISQMVWEYKKRPAYMRETQDYIANVKRDWSLYDLENAIAGEQKEQQQDINTKFGLFRLRKGLKLRGVELELCAQSEVIALYNIAAYFSNTFGRKLEHKSQIIKEAYEAAYTKDLETLNFQERRIEMLLQALKETFETFAEINRQDNERRDDLYALFGTQWPRLADFTFPELSEEQIRLFIQEVGILAGRSQVEITEIDGEEVTWKEVSGNVSGQLDISKTSLLLNVGQVITGILAPQRGNEKRKAGEVWKLLHAQVTK